MDAVLFLVAFVASVSGVYFLIFPDGGYKGGRNPYYGIQILFDREGWEWIHTWIGMAMVLVAILHLLFHWKWVVNTVKRIIKSVSDRERSMNSKSRINVLVDGILGLSFLVCAITGIYLFFVPELKGGMGIDPMIFFSRGTWDLLHTWSGVVMISAALIHLVIHWRWVVKVTRKLLVGKGLSVHEPQRVVAD